MVDTEVGDYLVIMNPWTLRLSLIVVFFVGVFVGTILVSILVYHGIEAIGTAFRVENVNVTVQLNQSILLEAMQDAVNRSSGT